MRKKLFLIAIAVLTVLTQCRKPNDIKPEIPMEGNVNIIISAKQGNKYSGAKSDVSEINVTTWNTGDRVYLMYNGKTMGGNLSAKASGDTVMVSGSVSSGQSPFTSPTAGDEVNVDMFYIGSGVTFTWPGTDMTSDIVMNIADQQKDSNYDVGEYQIAHANTTLTYDGGKKAWTLNGVVGFKPLTAIVRLNTGIGGSMKIGDASLLNGTANPYTGDDFSKSTTDGATDSKIYNTMTVSPATPTTYTCSGKNGISFNGGSDTYVSLLPSGTTDNVTFTVVWEQDGGVGSFPINGGIEENHLYCRVTGNYPFPIVLQSNNWVNFNEPGMEVNDLPLWATRNVGATNGSTITSWYGDQYAWGELEPYYADGHAYDPTCSNWRTMTTGAGNTDISNGYAGETYWNNMTNEFGATSEWANPPYEANYILKAERDIVQQHADWGGEWRMPTGGLNGEWKQLTDNTYFIWTTNYNSVTGLNGFIVYKVKNIADKGLWVDGTGAVHKQGETGTSFTVTGSYSTSDPHIFLPAAGRHIDKKYEFSHLDATTPYNKQQGYYWGSTLYSNPSDSRACQMLLRAYTVGSGEWDGPNVNPKAANGRTYGFSVRPVLPKPTVTGTGIGNFGSGTGWE